MIPRLERPHLAVVARYDRQGGIEIAGGPDDLRHLADLLLSERPEAVFKLTVPQAGEAAPFDGFVSSMSVETANQKVRITRRGDSICVAGSGAALTSLARSIEFVANGTEANRDGNAAHIHIEFYEGHPFLQSDSEPLTVALRSADDE